MSAKKKPFITKTELLKMFPWMTDYLFRTYLPPVLFFARGKNKMIPAWNREEVLEICRNDKNLQEERDKIRRDTQLNQDLQMAYQAFVSRFTPFEKFHYAEKLDRNFILHVGPTNSGKTYTALEALKGADSGVYLGPLRLMALEVFDKLNTVDIPCSLLTGEESIPIPYADFVASTVEMADFQKLYDVAVIDEAQMIRDSRRGAHWFDAICQINAKTVHVCLAPEAENLIVELMKSIDAPYEIIYHKRLAPLFVGKQMTGFDDILPGDAIIAFSRQKVLGIAAAMRVRGFSPAVIYGGLPPRSRRMEVEDYAAGRKNIIVATDAIGMGLSLPIRRIVFAEVRKFDGQQRRVLTPSEIKQIAGRAGRFGIYDHGEVTSFRHNGYISEALRQKDLPIEKLRISFPGDEAIASGYPMTQLLEEWQRLPKDGWFERENMGNAYKLLKIFPGKQKRTDRQMIYKLITCPVDTDRAYMVSYWKQCAEAVLADMDIPVPNFGMNSLENCEMQYRALDLYKIMCLRFDKKNYCEDFQDEVIQRISVLLQNAKNRLLLVESLQQPEEELA